MDLAARMVSEIPVDLAQRFCLMGSGAEVRTQLKWLASRLPRMQHVSCRPICCLDRPS